MDEEIDRAIRLLVSMLTRSTKSEDAARITQSAMNLAHVKETLFGIEEAKPKRGRPPKVAADEA